MTEAGAGPAGHCEICGRDEGDPRLLQQCFACGVTFHLEPSSSADGIDCGDAWVGEELGVHYYCQRCIDGMQDDALAHHGGDPALARERQLLQAISGGEIAGVPPPPPATPEPAGSSSDEPPPRPSRRGPRRRYRRLDRP